MFRALRFLFLLAVAGTAPIALAEDADLTGDWLLRYSARGAIDVNVCILKLEANDGSTLATVAAVPPRTSMVKVKAFRVSGKSVILELANGASFVGTLGADSKAILGSYGNESPARAALIRTDKGSMKSSSFRKPICRRRSSRKTQAAQALQGRSTASEGEPGKGRRQEEGASGIRQGVAGGDRQADGGPLSRNGREGRQPLRDRCRPRAASRGAEVDGDGGRGEETRAGPRQDRCPVRPRVSAERAGRGRPAKCWLKQKRSRRRRRRSPRPDFRGDAGHGTASVSGARAPCVQVGRSRTPIAPEAARKIEGPAGQARRETRRGLPGRRCRRSSRSPSRGGRTSRPTELP